MVSNRPARRPVAALFVACDAAGIAACSLGALLLAPGPGSASGRLGAAALVAASLLAGIRLTGVHTRNRRRIVPLPGDDLTALVGGLALGAVALTALRALAPGALERLFLPTTPLYAAVAASAALPVVRAGALGLTRHRRRPARVLVLGTGHVARDVAARLARTGQVDLVGHVDDEPVGGAAASGVLGPLSRLGTVCEELAVDRVVVAFSRSHPAEAAEALRALPVGVAVDIVPRYFEITGWHSSLDDVSGLTLVSLGDRIATQGARAAKRALDIAVAFAGLAVCLPVVALAAVAIRLESSGPVLFRQERLGRDRAPFTIMKLRTMTPLPEGALAATLPRLPNAHESDPRITPIAGLVRRLGIDELSQLANVLRGDMSLVGPRPLVPEECTAMEAWANRRFDVRPGMTGLWQVCGQHDLSFEELLRLDYQYATSWSLSTDLRVLVRTPARLLRGGGGQATPAVVLEPAATVRPAHRPRRGQLAGRATGYRRVRAG